MKNRIGYLFICTILAATFLLHTEIIAMNTTLVCPEQLLIDAISSNQRTDVILRNFFIAPYADPNDITNINYQDADGNTPLMVAVAHNRPEIVEKIIRDYNPKLALKNKSGKHIIELCDENNGTPDEKEMIKGYILPLALSVCETLCGKGALNQVELQELNLILKLLYEQTYNKRLSTLLRVSIKNYNHEVIGLLAKRLQLSVEQAIFRFLDSKRISSTPLEFEKLVNHYRQCINYETPDGYTLLSNAIHNQQVDAVRILLKAGATPNDTVEANTQKIPLITFASFYPSTNDKKWQIVRMLLDHGADINTKVEGYPPILWEAISEDKDYSINHLLLLINVPNIDLNITHDLGLNSIAHVDISISFIDFVRTMEPSSSRTQSDIIDILQVILIKLCLGQTDSVENQLTDALCQLSNDLCTIYNGWRTKDIEVFENIKKFDSRKCILSRIIELGGPNIDLSDPKYCEAVYRLSPLLDNTDDIFKEDRAFAHEYAKTLIRNITQSHDKQYLDLLKRAIYKDKSLGLFKALYEGSLRDYCNNIDLKISMMAECIEYNFAAGVKYLCECDDMNIIEGYIDGQGTTPLIYALKKGSLACVQELINHRCNPNPPYFRTISCENGKERRVTSKGIAINIAQQYCPEAVALLEQAQTTTVYDLPADMWALISSYASQGTVIKDRLAQFSHSLAATSKQCLSVITNAYYPLSIATTQATNDEKSTMLFNALSSQDFTLFIRLLKGNPHLVNSIKDSAGFPLLIRAIYNHVPLFVIQAIIEAGADINNKLYNFNIIKQRMIAIPFLFTIELFPTTTTHSDGGITALDLALIQYCQPFIGKNSTRNRNNSEDIILYLQSKGGLCSEYIPYQDEDYNIETATLKSSLIIAIYHGNDLALKILLQQPDIDINSKIGTCTPLCYAASLSSQGHIMLEMLANDPRININATTTDGKTAFDILLDRKKFNPRHNDATKLLISKGAKTSAQLAEELARKSSRDNTDSTSQTNPASSPQSTNSQQLAIVAAPAPAPVPGGSQSISHHHWYKSPSWLWVAAAAACTAIIYGTYNYVYPSDDPHADDEQETDPGAVVHIQK